MGCKQLADFERFEVGCGKLSRGCWVKSGRKRCGRISMHAFSGGSVCRWGDGLGAQVAVCAGSTRSSSTGAAAAPAPAVH